MLLIGIVCVMLWLDWQPGLPALLIVRVFWLARGLVADAKILALNEATANIDSHTEILIQKALQQLLQGRTGLGIAHRLATVRTPTSLSFCTGMPDRRGRPHGADDAGRALREALRSELRHLRRPGGR